ncbi:MAG: membrane protein insertion efficiency factor YidD [Candidatus Omnitrophota bacterium]
MKDFFITLIGQYQNKISPVIKPVCRFNPTCSEYAVFALRKYNLLTAFLKISIRILRRNSFTKKEAVDLPRINL